MTRSADLMAAFADLEKRKAALLDTLQDWPPERLAFRPDPESWSAIEMVDHLARVEAQILAGVRRGLKDPWKLGIRDRLGVLFIDFVFRSRRRVKVPKSAAAVLPGASLSPGEILEAWNNNRRELELFLRSLGPDQLSHAVFRHPVSGSMSVPQVLRFFAVHIDHHRFQLDRIAAASSVAI